MFTIIGGDGKEYGPATSDQVKGWIAAGRANLDTKAKAFGTDEWRRLGDYPEFSGDETTPPVMAAPADSTLADRIVRLGAWFLDNVIAFICCLPGCMMIGFSMVQAMMMGHTPDLDAVDTSKLAGGILLLAAGGLVLLVIQIWLLTTRGQTIGKRVLGIRIVKVADNSNPGFVSAVLLRMIVPGILSAIPYLGFVFFLVDVCFIFRADRRCIHDLIAGTKVVRG